MPYSMDISYRCHKINNPYYEIQILSQTLFVLSFKNSWRKLQNIHLCTFFQKLYICTLNFCLFNHKLFFYFNVCDSFCLLCLYLQTVLVFIWLLYEISSQHAIPLIPHPLSRIHLPLEQWDWAVCHSQVQLPARQSYDQ